MEIYNIMKKVFTILLVLLLIVPVTESQAQNKALEKALKKEFKTKRKELEKGGWKIYGTSRSADVALLKHFDKLSTMGDDAIEVLGVASKFKSKNTGVQMAYNNAVLTYAQKAGSQVKGRVISDIAGNGTDNEGEFEHFYAAYEREVEKEIKGELEPSFTIIRENSDGTFEMQSYFIASESAATKARIRAYENAMKESEAAQKYAGKISNFIKEGVKAEK